MNILITGATGFIGAQYIKRFSHHHFTALCRNTEAGARMLPSYVTCISDLSTLQNLDSFDAIINLAGEPIADKRWTTKQKNVISQSRWHITQQLVDLIKRSDKPPAVFISGSAIGYYGDGGAHKLTEDSIPTQADFANSLCKRWEDIAMEAKSDCRVIILRTGIVLGTQGGALAKMLLPFKLGFGGRIGNGNQMMSWIHQSDAINAIEFLLNQPNARGPFNITAPKPVSNNCFTQILAKALHRKAMLPLPANVLTWLMGESASLLLGSQNVYPAKLLQGEFKFEYEDLTSALDDLLIHH